MAIYGLRYPTLGPTSYFRSEDDLTVGDKVFIDAEHGPAVADIISGPLTALRGSSEDDLPPIVRKATPEDLEVHERNLATAAEARAFCRNRIRTRQLDMKLVDVEVYHDASKFIFYFTAPTRIDFRELVKDLVREYRVRIELRQIGVRHETQMLGAIGSCGQVCCCRKHLRKFAPVTIRMAKEQNLFLNPSKISGICGRLLCCLSYEQDNYEQFHRESPRPGKRYQTAKGLLKVLRVNMFKNTVETVNENNEEAEFSLDEWNGLKPWRSTPPGAEQEEGQDSPSW